MSSVGRYVSRREIAATEGGLKVGTIARRERRDPSFPRAIHLSATHCVYERSLYEAWLAARVEASRQGPRPPVGKPIQKPVLSEMRKVPEGAMK